MNDSDIKEHLDEVEAAKEVFGDKIETVTVAGGKEHPTYAGVLNEAHTKGLLNIEVEILQYPNSDNHFLAVCKATVTFKDGRIFTEVGDASPKNVNKMIAPHIVRMAATRAKGRALRDALNIAQALKEELGGDEDTSFQNRSSESTDTKECPIHGETMYAKDGKYGKFYSHKLEDDSWCNGK